MHIDEHTFARISTKLLEGIISLASESFKDNNVILTCCSMATVIHINTLSTNEEKCIYNIWIDEDHTFLFVCSLWELERSNMSF